MNRMAKIISLYAITIFLTISAQDLSQLHIVGSPELVTDGFVSSDIKDANGRICAGIMIVSNLRGLSYQSNNGIVKVNRLPGQDVVFVSPDERVIDIFHTDYSPLRIILSEYGIKLQAGRIWQIKLGGLEKEEYRGFGRLEILSKSFGLRVEIDGLKIAGRTPLHMDSVKAGEHIIHVDGSRDYLNYDTTVIVRDKDTTSLTIIRKKSYGSLTVKTDPKNASVFINGKEEFSAQLFKGTRLDPGKYEVRVEDEWHFPFIDSVDIDFDDSIKLDVKLTPKTGTIAIDVSPSNTILRLIRKQGRRFKSEGSCSFDSILIGTYYIIAQKDSFLSQVDTVTLELNDKIEKEYLLVPGTDPEGFLDAYKQDSGTSWWVIGVIIIGVIIVISMMAEKK